MSLITIDDRDQWLIQYDACEKLQHEIMEQLTSRGRVAKASDVYANISVQVRLKMKQFNKEFSELLEKNAYNYEMNNITEKEYERRTRLVEGFQSKLVQMKQIFDEYKRDDTRKQLMRKTSNWQAEGDEDVALLQPDEAGYSVDQFKQDKQRMLMEQERGLEELSKVIARQKNIATTITNEVDYQNEILDDIAVDIEQIDTRVGAETRNIQGIGRRESMCGHWSVIVGLFGVIFVLYLLP